MGTTVGDFFVGISGQWVNTKEKSYVVNVYGPHTDESKIKMWEALNKLQFDITLPWVICGDFNEVREQSERKNCEFVESRAKRFNDFKNNNCLVDVPLGGRKFTRIIGNGKKLTMVLDRDISDHCPIVLRDDQKDFGPKPIKIFDEWFEIDGVDQIIREAWDEGTAGRKSDWIFLQKLKKVKHKLRNWCKCDLGLLDAEVADLKKEVNSWEIAAESRNLDGDELKKWSDSRKRWFEKDKIKSNMLKQKARIR
ncbi:uncharacterized protein [Rutidosis leptorrhynchoides]|uniref:uncharacterized protein n=1 Tax=Rutidosis leptorrhynchoides TaxID=125765 RepID=UPI003A98D8D3